MRIILKQDLGKTGSLGDEISVKPGYARNFLIPNGLAIQITRDNEKFIRHQREYLEKKRSEAIERNKSLADKLKDLSLKFTMPAGKSGKLFGSVTGKMIMDEINKLGIELEKKSFHMGTTIKTLGTHKVSVKLHSQVAINIMVNVLSENEREQAKESSKTAPLPEEAVQEETVQEEAVQEETAPIEETPSE